MTRDLTTAQVTSLVAVFEANAKHGTAIAIEAVIAADRATRLVVTPSAGFRMLDAGVYKLMRMVAQSYGVTLAEVRSDDKGGADVWAARREIYWRVRRLNYSYQAIGLMVRKDYSTVIWGVKKFEAQLAVDPVLRRRVGLEPAALSVVESRAA